MAANRYAEMVRWMAWPRIKNSRSSAQTGTQPHDGVQATVTPAPDAEQPRGSGQNTGISGTRHAVAYGHSAVRQGPFDEGLYHGGSQGGGTEDQSAGSPRPRRLLRPIRYAHSQPSGSEEPAAPTVPVEAAGGPVPPAPPPAGTGPGDTTLADGVLTGTVLPHPGSRYGAPEAGPGGDELTSGLVYEAPSPGSGGSQAELADPVPAEETGAPGRADRPVSNEGLGIFGGVATTEATDEPPAREFRQPRLRRPPAPESELQPVGEPQPEPGPAPAAGAVWNQSIGSAPQPSGEAEERKPNTFWRVRRLRGGGGASPDDDQLPRVAVRDLPPDVQMRFLRIRATIAVIVGAVVAVLTRNWEIALTLAILAWIIDTVRRSRTAALYMNGAAFPGARKRTSKQLAKMRRDGYLYLNARPIPNSREFIDHLVIGPTGVYAIDSERWNPNLPIRTWNQKKLYHGPESQKPRLEHAVWEARQASELLSEAVGTEINVRPALAIYGPKIPWDIATIRDVDVFTGTALRKYLKQRYRMRSRGKEGVPSLTPEQVAAIYDAATRILPDVVASASPGAYTPVG
jgi:Nuclease-related domain